MRGVPISDDTLKYVAERYEAAAESSRTPTKILMGELGVCRPTLSRWIRKARDRGYLPEAGRGIVLDWQQVGEIRKAINSLCDEYGVKPRTLAAIAEKTMWKPEDD